MYKGRWYTASQLLSTRQGWAQHVPLAKDLTNTTSKKRPDPQRLRVITWNIGGASSTSLAGAYAAAARQSTTC